MRYVLFVCTQNAGRSQIAQAFFERHGPDDVRAESAGDAPAGEVHPVVVEAMREVGIDLSDRRPKKLTLEMQLHADWAITLACGAQCPYVPTTIEDWDIDDPAGQPLEEVRRIRDDIEARVIDLAQERIEEIRADHRQHKMRLAQLVPGLVREFERPAQRPRDPPDRRRDPRVLRRRPGPLVRAHARQPPRQGDHQAAQRHARVIGL